MLYRPLGNTGFEISAITYGGIVSMNDGQPSSDRYVSWAIDQGINYFDVAPTYGDAQEKLGNSLLPYRKDIYLACKTNQRKRKEAEEKMHESLKLLHTDYFDNYQLHELSTMEELETAFAPGGVMEMVRNMKEQGITRKVGITCHSEAVALKAIEWYPFDTVLFPFNWQMHMGYRMGEKLLRAARDKGMGVLCMKSMIERAWRAADTAAKAKYNKSWCKPIDTTDDEALLIAAVKYAISLGVDTIIPPGNYDHFSFAVNHLQELFGEPLTEAERALLQERLAQVIDEPFFAKDTLLTD